MKKNMLSKTLVMGIVVLFIGAVVVPSISSVNNQMKIKDTPIGAASFDPFIEGWNYRKMITINHDKVAGNLIYFPVLISTTDSDLRDKAQSDGDDILFMDDTGEANQLYHEIEYYDSTTGELVAWVKTPLVSYTQDTIFYMYYGNTSCGNQQNPVNVWDSDYIAVYHMHDSSGYIQDSTAYSNDAVGIYGDPNYQQTLDVGYAISFDGDACFDLPSYGLSGNNFVSTTLVLAKWDSCELGTNPWVLQLDKEVRLFPFFYWGNGDVVCAQVGIAEPDPKPNYTIGQADTTNSHLYQMHIKESDEIATWKDGIERDHDTMTQIETFDLQANTLAGCWQDGEYLDRFFDGMIDEVRISKVKRSDNWIKTTYETICNPSSFLSLGLEEPSFPPNTPIIDGPITGKPGTSYIYTFNSTDPDGHDVWYYIDWGDNTYEDWFGPFASGVEIEKTHTFENSGNFIIYAKAKDTYDLESLWGTLTVTMPRNKVIYKPLLQFFQNHPNMFPVLQKLLLLRFGL